MRVYTAIAVLALLSACLVSASDRFQQVEEEDELPTYDNPIGTADKDEIKELPGLNVQLNFKQYSGYLAADNKPKPKKLFHYWFVESQSKPSEDPILLWLNGGPGCSSMGGLFTELGPFSVKEDGKTLKLNYFSWNKVANVLFLESPAQVGFSYTTEVLPIHSDDSTAKENHQALKSFMKKFPQYKNNSLYLSGESYAGVYLPTLGELVDADEELNLKGIAIGNGYLDVGKLTDSLVFFAYHHGLVGMSSWEKISRNCCNRQPPSRESCTLSGGKSSFSCQFAVQEILSVLDNSGLNPYNLYADCPHVGNSVLSRSKVTGSKKGKAHRTKNIAAGSNREIVDRALRSLVLNTTSHADHTYFRFEPLIQKHGTTLSRSLRVEPPCVDDSNLISYLNRKEVRKAIHIPAKVSRWDTCAPIVYFMKYPKLPGGLAPQMKGLIESKRNLTMLVYNGDVDTVCNFLGDEWFVDGLGRKVVEEYSMWKVNKQVAGFVKHYDGITFATIRGSGHMVPGDRPQEALEMIKIFLDPHNHKNVWL